MASTYLTRTPGSASNRQTWTWSAWIKLGVLGTDRNLFGAYAHSADNLKINIADTDQVSIRFYNNTEYQLGLNRVFRDTSAWYHLVFAIDTTLATEADRFIIYVNGVRETSFQAGANSQPTQNLQMTINEATATQIGRFNTGSYFDGEMSHINFIDGTAYDATAFGEYDANGVWTINTSPSVTYGNNGFFILKNGNSLTDQSGEGNDFTLGAGTLTNTLDCPDNVFATLNSLDNYYAGGTFANGNNTVTTINTGYTYNTSTFGVATGKWYWECKWSAQPTGSSDQVQIGIAKRPAPSSTTWLGQQLYTYGYQGSSGHVQNNNVNASGSVATPYSVGDIISVAMDLDNNKIHFAKNGAWTNSSDPAANSGGVTITAPDSTPEDSGVYFAAFGDANNSLQETGQFNFGNGFFGTSAVTSAGTAGSTPGTFEYDVPSGYEPLTTKGLNA